MSRTAYLSSFPAKQRVLLDRLADALADPRANGHVATAARLAGIPNGTAIRYVRTMRAGLGAQAV